MNNVNGCRMIVHSCALTIATTRQGFDSWALNLAQALGFYVGTCCFYLCISKVILVLVLVVAHR
jgi:hypothetical protein